MDATKENAIASIVWALKKNPGDIHIDTLQHFWKLLDSMLPFAAEENVSGMHAVQGIIELIVSARVELDELSH